MTIRCPKHENPIIEKKMWRTKIYECDKYDYDGECLNCKLNTEHKKGKLYSTCPHFIKGCEGYCSQTNYMRGNYGLGIEQWKPIKGYEGMYEVSTYGRVRSLNYNHTKRPKLLSLGLSEDKRYYSVCLCKQGKVKRFRINRLVAETFIPNPCNYPIVNHIDGNSLNNHVQNLEWCTQSHNINHGKRNQIVSQKLRNRKETSKPIMAILPNGDVEQYPSISEAARKLNGSSGTIWQALNGKVKRVYGGRQWRYING